MRRKKVKQAALKRLVADVLADERLREAKHIRARLSSCINVLFSFAQNDPLEPPRCQLLPSVLREEAGDTLQSPLLLLLLLRLLLLLFSGDKALPNGRTSGSLALALRSQRNVSIASVLRPCTAGSTNCSTAAATCCSSGSSSLVGVRLQVLVPSRPLEPAAARRSAAAARSAAARSAAARSAAARSAAARSAAALALPPARQSSGHSAAHGRSSAP
ncbi:hypothetical protein EK21DRAFT_94778 [Setomelanomma holmii]|uniref:Uncharacterized protein n=1 Tax=Setomelanomma holmii TaxID=210430 RepID=A0A9P4GXN0_9PLEO|nr:hypothetical protein EK21DRAFT_94778 [Setomelanomma holmii]